MNMYPAQISKHKLNYENQIILLMIPNREEWYYLAEEKIPVLLRGITLKHVGDFYGLNCLPSFITKRQTLTSWKIMWK